MTKVETESTYEHIGSDDKIMGVMEVSDKYREVGGWTIGKSYCSNCRKGIHSTPNKLRCKDASNCECKCQTHYVGQDGLLRPYGVIDDSLERMKSSGELEEEKKANNVIDNINQEFNKLKESNTAHPPKTK